MKKFHKILFTILIMVAIVAASAVVALAATPTKPISVKPAASHVIGTSPTFNTLAPATAVQDSESQIGRFVTVEAENGNIYVLNEYATATGTSADCWGFYPTYQRSDYDVTKYKYYAIDFDLMTTTGSYGGMKIQTDIWKNKGTISDSYYGSPKSASDIGYSTTPYEWQHVTYIIEHSGDGLFTQYYYINGELSYSANATSAKANNSAWTALNGDYTNVIVGQVRFFSVTDTKSGVGFDNFHTTFFPENYDCEQIANYYYSEDYVFPYGRTEATIGDAIYDDLYKAINAAEEGDTVKLTLNATKPLLIDEFIGKNILIDTNVYNENNEPTGEFYTFNYESDKYLIPIETEEGSGIFRFARDPNAVDVIWDPVCEGDCDCYGAHSLNYNEIMLLGSVPAYTLDLPADVEIGGLVTKFIGWSYENDGTVDELVAISEEDTARGYVNLYPVYESNQYDFSLTVNGVVTYYTADQYSTLFAAAQRADNVERKITLLRDAEVYDVITFSTDSAKANVVVTFDLRGNTLTRVNLVGNKFKYDPATEQYVANGTLAQATNGTYMFYCNRKNNVFTITSSTEEKGTIITYKVSGDIYYDENGKMEKYDATTISASSFMNWYNSTSRHVTLENINIYASNIFNAAGGSNQGCSFTMNNCNYYATYGSDNKMDMTLYFETGTTFDVNVTNSLFYFPEGTKGTTQFFRLADYGKNSTYHVTFDNCDIIGLTKITFFQFYSDPIKANLAQVDVINTRFYNVVGNSQMSTYLGENTLYTLTDNSSIAPGCISVPVSADRKTVPYTVPTTTTVTIDSVTKQPVLDVNSVKDISVSFKYEIEKISELENSENIIYDDVRISMLYYANFNMMVYVPVIDGVTNVTVDGFTKTTDSDGHNIVIGNKEFYAFKKSLTTVRASDLIPATINFTKDGASYRYTYKISALVYADLILSDPINDVETKAVASMVRYIKEARSAASYPNTNIQDELDRLIALGNLGDYKSANEYDSNGVTPDSYAGLAGVTLTFAVNGTNAAYVIQTLNANIANGQNATVTAKLVTLNEDGSVKEYIKNLSISKSDVTSGKTVIGAKHVVTTASRVYDIVDTAIEITVTVPGADGAEDTVLTGVYSLGAYIQAKDNALAKAMYEFGIAAKAYREYLIENT